MVGLRGRTATMRSVHRLWVSLLMVGAVAAVVSEPAGEAGCDSLGYTNLLQCKTCDKLANIVKDVVLETECRQCCQADDETETVRFNLFIAIRIVIILWVDSNATVVALWLYVNELWGGCPRWVLCVHTLNTTCKPFAV